MCISRLLEPRPLQNSCDLGSDCMMGRGRGRQCGGRERGMHGVLVVCSREGRVGGGRESGGLLCLASHGPHWLLDSLHTLDLAPAELNLCLKLGHKLHLPL